ncbi:coenzyme F420-dependent oxidoreductase, NP1902A family [Halovivax ruber XH-70]|uniref:Coenzyme F420-dependent oxidoreductase, NP1902A family n=1 Tax=Halovivax ruber (strain DSM 18193 / JCM 13892 / XH-70) TaxID=797302 RepID=L0I988_HALRX|nr:TIGR04024 family LLM class F420-dependent oxidoreductase [Halovivax ruber]AGB15373.1 coenzyme F420-dependent oxidoreductase, NP1902A family [Halovivax ruber XH-70]
MPELDWFLDVSQYDRPQAVAERAARAEELGYRTVTVGETTGWNVVPALSLIADRTDEIDIGTAVLSPYGRSPALLAQTALTLADASDGRFRLGLGPSSPAITERWHGRSFDRPLRRLRETVELVRTISTEGTSAYHGDVIDVDGLAFERPLPESPPPIDLATLGPTATELAGRFGDGWLPQLFTRDGLETRLEDLRRGANLGDRTIDDVRVAPIVRCVVDDDPDRARSLARSAVAFMLGAYGPFYGKSVAEQGYPDVVEAIRDAWAERDTDAMANALPDDLLDELAATGTPDEVREWVADYAAIDGVDAVQVTFVDGMDEADRERSLSAIASLAE